MQPFLDALRGYLMYLKSIQLEQDTGPGFHNLESRRGCRMQAKEKTQHQNNW